MKQHQIDRAKSVLFASVLIAVMLPTSALALLGEGASRSNPDTKAQAEIDVTPKIELLIPQQMPMRADSWGYITQISAVDVDVRMSEALASTRIEITVENKGNRTTQAMLVLPVPAGSAITKFGIDGIGDGATAQLLHMPQARHRYNEIVRQMKDPGLLEFIGNAMIQSSVFPVDPGAKRVMTIEYEQALDAHRGRVEYVFPRSAGYADSSIDWTLDIDLASSSSMGPVFSPSHPIVSKIVDDRSMKVAVPMLDEPGAFRLYAVLGANDVATTLLYPDDSGASSGYFMFVADVPQPRNVDAVRSREVTIVIDRSGSMGGEKIKQARESAKQIVHGMRKGERVRIVDYSDDVRSFSADSVEINDETVPKLIAYIDNIESRGGTNLHDALVEAMSAQLDPVYLPMMLFLTDGLPTVGVTDESAIRQAAIEHNKFKRRVFTFGVGFDVNVPLLDGLAMDTRAESTFVLPGEDVEMKVGQVFDKLEGPVMTYPALEAYDNQGIGYHKIEGVDKTPQPYSYSSEYKLDLSMLEPRELGDLYAGSRLVVLGRYEGLGEGPSSMMIHTTRSAPDFSVRFGARPIRNTFSRSDATVRHAFIARLWAQRRIDSLINEIRLAGADGSDPDQELVDEIVRLSLEHGIMSEYTAFLADEELAIETASEQDSDGNSYMYEQAQRELATQNSVRSGRGAMSQTVNRDNAEALQIQSDIDSSGEESPFAGGIVQALTSNKANKFYDADMKQVTIRTVQRGAGATLFKKNGRWVDAKLGEHAGDDPEIIVSFDDEAYWALVEDLVAQGRQWILANRGDVYFINHSKRVLVHNPK